MPPEWLYIVEYKPHGCLHWVRLAQFRDQGRAVEFSETARESGKRDSRATDYRVTPAKLMD